jgi:hypothetical protein
MVCALFDKERRKAAKAAIERGELNLFRRKPPEIGGGPVPGVYWKPVDPQAMAGRTISGSPVSADFNLLAFEGIEICGFTFIYKGNRSANRLSDHLDFDIRRGDRIQSIHIPLFGDSFFDAPEIGMIIQISPESRSSNPDSAEGKIKFKQTR